MILDLLTFPGRGFTRPSLIFCRDRTILSRAGFVGNDAGRVPFPTTGA